MEGIITGIGDKELGKNIIKPEYDAVINDFIIGKNTILEGLELNGNILSAGTCILCGYRGIMDTPKELDTTAYVYGEFTLNSIYGGSGEDSFNIVTSNTALTKNVNPTEITSAGVYYLLLYVNGEKQVDLVVENGITKEVGEYPLKSYYSVETENVLDNAVISETATTPTSLNELDEIVTDLHISQPNRVANTEYVHAQIEKEIDYDTATANVMSNGKIVGTATFYRKAKYVKGVIKSSGTYTVFPITLSFPSGFIPNESGKIAFMYPKEYNTGITSIENIHSIGTLNFSSNSSETTYSEITQRIFYSTSAISFEANFGYKCQ